MLEHVTLVRRLCLLEGLALPRKQLIFTAILYLRFGSLLRAVLVVFLVTCVSAGDVRL